MLRLVTTPKQAFDNINRFEEELRRSPELQGRIAYARSWYAHQDEKGRWRFAPSKFAGYAEVDAKTYLQATGENDGRRTEAQLQLFFMVIDPTSELYHKLSSELVTFLAKYGKAPSTKMRINVVRARRQFRSDETPSSDVADRVVDLMIEVASTLPPPQLNYLREQLEHL